jgi:(2Fe-2S) ferredoxin
MSGFVVSICSGPDCTGNGSDALVPVAERCAKELGLQGRCRIKRGGCYGLCEQGANVIVRVDDGAPFDPLGSDDYERTYAPGETHYPEMDPERMERVMREHVAGGVPVEALRAKP